MKILSHLLITSIAVTFSTSVLAENVQSAEDFAKGSYIFVFKENTRKADIKGIARAMASGKGRVHHVYRNTIKGFSASMSPTAANRLLKNKHIAYIEQNAVVTAIKREKPGKPDRETPQPDQTTPYGIERVNGGTTTSLKKAWIIDTGINLDHPDLYVNLMMGRNFVARGKSTTDDANGHGTHVAGIIAAKNNDIGVVGVAPGSVVVPIRVLDKNGSGTWAGVIGGIDYTADKASSGDVVNMSLGGGASLAVDTAVIKAADKGLLFAIAAGNSGADAASSSPARVNHSNVYTIAAIDSEDDFASFSNTNPDIVDFAAPGVSIYSTYKNGGYGVYIGVVDPCW